MTPGSSDRHPPVLLSWKPGKAKAQIAVSVAGIVPVAIGRPAVPGVVVPAAAPIHPVSISECHPKLFY